MLFSHSIAIKSQENVGDRASEMISAILGKVLFEHFFVFTAERRIELTFFTRWRNHIQVIDLVIRLGNKCIGRARDI